MPILRKQQSPMAAPSSNGATPSSIIDRIRPIGYDKNDGIKIMLYGRSGTGKTSLWATFPKPIWAIICSGPMRAGETRTIDTPEYRASVKEAELLHTTDILDAVGYLKVPNCPFKTVVLDHSAGLQDLFIKEILGLDEIPVAKFRKAGKGETWGIMDRKEWGVLYVQFVKVMIALLGVRQNVVIIAHERNSASDENTDILLPHVGAALSPSVASWLNRSVDYICQTFIRQKFRVDWDGGSEGVGNKIITPLPDEKPEFCLRAGPHGVYHTKFRIPRGTDLPDVIVNPDYKDIAALIQGAKK